MPKISIIIPVYKVEKYIEECLNSILNQTFTDFEVILVDDGSPDNSGAICDKYAEADHRFRVIHKENEGVGAARNTGLDIAQGKYVVFVDSDDFCDTSYLENFTKGSNNDSDLVIQGMKSFPEGYVPTTQFEAKVYTISNLVDCVLSNKLLTFGAPYCKMFKSSILNNERVRFSTTYSFGEDTYFFFDYLAHVNTIQIVGSVGYNYRCDLSDSLSVKNHEFEDLTKFATESLALVRSIDKDRKLELEYSFNYAGLYARALANMYRLKYPYRKRRSCISTVKSDCSNISFPTIRHPYILLYLLVRLMPIFVVDCILYLYYKISH